MNTPQNFDQLTRRKMLAQLGSAAIVTAGGMTIARAATQSPPPADGYSSAGVKPTNPISTNKEVTEINPDSYVPPSSDSGDVDTFKYPFSLGHNRVSKGGWARQVTVRDLPIAKTLAGVNMRLETGAVRELHWHAAAEWSFMLYGKARITGVDGSGRAFVEDVGVGDLWNFPSGIPHSIQGLGPDGCEFLLVFDDGAFSEFDTFLITDWITHTPKDILAKNFNLPEGTFDSVPKHELYIFEAPVPKSLSEDQKAAIGPEGNVPTSFSYQMLAQSPDKKTRGGEVRIVDSGKFKAATTVAAAHVRLQPGGLRELHWHPNADEWQYFIKGKGRQTIFKGGGKARTMDFQVGDVGYIPKSLPHYIENTGDEDLEFLEMFKSDFYQDISLGQWISHLPPELVEAHLHLDANALSSIPKEKVVNRPV
ncbi:MAG TPA: cupin domain-containing protein [Tepidisphaeraceae bacterium]|jgi:oxalate decarboxylase|nr:cupin domain-containing protein [Tepidisphaeraceae bacterium]